MKKGTIRNTIFLGITIAIAIILLSIFPDRSGATISMSWRFLLEMLSILPTVMVLMGLFKVWVSKETVELQFLGAKFMAARLILTIIFVVIMGLSIEKIIEWTSQNIGITN